MELPEKIKNAVTSLSKLPGIGEKSAFRMALYLTRLKNIELELFSKSINDLGQLKFCRECGFFCEDLLCEVCLNPHRNSSRTVCVVESITDFLAIERSGQHKGVYHILGGVLNPLLGIGPDQLKIEQLSSRIKKLDIKDVILAVNPSVEGDATCSFIKNYLGNDILVHRIGFGIPIGGSLEFLDPMTISKALENRKSF